MRRIVLGMSIGFYTLIFGMLAILGCLVIPNGNPLVWFARPWAWCILRTSRVTVHTRGREKLGHGGPFIYITNHQSYFDVPALISALPGQYRVIAKQGLFKIPVFGWALSLAGFIKIDRTDREKSLRSLQTAAAKIRSGTSIVVFAEGTRSPDGQLQPFKKGGFILAINSGCPLVPISISGSRAVLPKNTLDIAPGPIDVVIGNPIPTTDHGYQSRNQLIREVREAIETGFTPLRSRDLQDRPSRPVRAAAPR